MFEPVIPTPSLAAVGAVAPLKPVSRALLRCPEHATGGLSERLGIDLPRTACRATRGDSMSALWLGPDEWLLIGVTLSDSWVAALSARLNDVLCSLVDVSHRQVAFSLSGHRAEDILASGCALDLSIAAFASGMCTRTMFAKAEVVLWRTGADSFHLETWRSFARYVEALLHEAETEA